jgi:hypothetical protein
MRIGDTLAMRILRLVRRRYEQHKGPAVKRTFNRTGWRLVLWVILASAEYAAWLQYIRCRLWRHEVVIADRYLYDFEAELRLRLQRRMRLARALLSFLRWLAPKPNRAYLLRIDPELSKIRKPEPDYRGLDPADLQLRYDVLVPRYGLRVFDGCQPLEEVASAIVHDAVSSYMESPRPPTRDVFFVRPRRSNSRDLEDVG